MSISMGKTGRSAISDPNMTPMIDVLLVLIVIFMIAQPMLQKSIDIQLPLEKPTQPNQQENTIILEIAADGTQTINTQAVPPGGLEARLREIYTGRPDKIMFIKAAPEVVYGDVITALDAARGAGVVVLGAMLPQAGQQPGTQP
jgi:biopolymer transport protein ExbD